MESHSQQVLNFTQPELRASPSRASRSSNIVHPIPNPQVEVAQASQPDAPPCIEVESNNTHYLVSPQQYEQAQANVVLSAVAWSGLALALIIMSIADCTSDSTHQRVQSHWLALLVTLSLSCLLLCGLAVFYRRTLSWNIKLTIANTTWAFILTTVFYWMQIKWILPIVSVVSVAQVVIFFVCLQSKRNTVIFLLFASILVLSALKLDGYLPDYDWELITILPVSLAIGFIGALVVFFFMASKAYHSIQQIHMEVVAPIYNGIVLGLFAFVLFTIFFRIWINNSIYMALPTSIMIILVLVFCLRPYRNELALYYASAATSVIFREAQHLKFLKIEEQSTLYKITNSWLSLREKTASKRCQKSRVSKRKSHGQNQNRSNTSMLNIQNSQNVAQQSQREECSVCLTNLPSMCWIPCGHLSVCQQCGEYLLKQGKLECVMCKQKLEEVYHVAAEEGSKVRSNYVYRRIL